MGYREVSFGLDEFGKPKELSVKDSIGQLLMNLFFLRPGTYQSMPEIGLNIQEYLIYKTEDEIDLEELKGKIYDQCSLVLDFLNIQDVEAYTTQNENGEMVVIINIPVVIDQEVVNFFIGFQKNGLDNSIQYQFQTVAETV